MSSYCIERGAYGDAWEVAFVDHLNAEGIKTELLAKKDYGNEYRKYSELQLDAKVYHSNGLQHSIIELKRKTWHFKSLEKYSFPTVNLDTVKTFNAKAEKALLYIVGNPKLEIKSAIGVPVLPHLWQTKRGEQSGDLLYECPIEYCLDFSETMNQIAYSCGYAWQPF